MSGRAVEVIWNVVLGRVLPCAFFGGLAAFTVWGANVEQATAGESFGNAARFASDLAMFFFYALVCITYFGRLPRRAGKRGALVVAVTLGPLLCFLVAAGRHASHPMLDAVSAILVAIGASYALVSLAYLRASFSILPEARELVTNGPFALSRHPVYLGEAIAAIGVFLPLAGVRSLALIPYLACQAIRIRWEEKVLEGEFPEYASYASRVPRYLPFCKP